MHGLCAEVPLGLSLERLLEFIVVCPEKFGQSLKSTEPSFVGLVCQVTIARSKHVWFVTLAIAEQLLKVSQRWRRDRYVIPPSPRYLPEVDLGLGLH